MKLIVQKLVLLPTEIPLESKTKKSETLQVIPKS